MKLCTIIALIFLIPSCKNNTTSEKLKTLGQGEALQSSINTNGKTIEERFKIPDGYKRVKVDSSSFENYLRQLPLKDVGEKVKYFDENLKSNNNVYDAVVDLPIGNRDLHQCADAVIRLRAEYFYGKKDYDSIHFNFTNGFQADYTQWRKGKRIVVDGNNVNWKDTGQASDAYSSFWKYLEMVFSYAGTTSLEKELKSISLERMKIGDVFIKGGFPGHAVIVVDMAINKSSGGKIFLLAQSYMPAQEIQILKNPNNRELSPWYSATMANELKTPEWVFSKNQLKRF